MADPIELYEDIRALLIASEEHDADGPFVDSLVRAMPTGIPEHVDTALCVLADAEYPLSESLQDVVAGLLASKNPQIVQSATSCLLSCGREYGRLQVAAALQYESPHQKLIEAIVAVRSTALTHE